MNWELDALKILARNPTVPGIALEDAISEITRLREALAEANEDAERLEKYSHHVERCRIIFDEECTCGHEQAIKFHFARITEVK